MSRPGARREIPCPMTRTTSLRTNDTAPTSLMLSSQMKKREKGGGHRMPSAWTRQLCAIRCGHNWPGPFVHCQQAQAEPSCCKALVQQARRETSGNGGGARSTMRFSHLFACTYRVRCVRCVPDRSTKSSGTNWRRQRNRFKFCLHT